MKINWGTGIVISLVLFAAMLVAYMIGSARNPPDLVTPNYYEEEIVYQNRIDFTANAKALGELELNLDNGLLNIVFPVGFNAASASGNIHFYKPNNANLDFDIPLKIDANNAQSVKVTKIVKGKWVVKVTMQAAGKNYYWENQITL